MPFIELSIRFPSPHHVSVKFAEQESETLTFESPVSKKDLDDLRWYIEVYAAQYTGEPDDKDVKERIEPRLITLGNDLFNAVFRTDFAQALFQQFQQQSTNRLLTIYSNDAEILALPWELLRQPDSDFLSQQQPPISIRRHCVKSTSPTFTLHAKPKLRLLFIVSRPSDQGFLDPRLDPQAVIDALTEKAISQIEVEFLRPATRKKLIERLNNQSLPVNIIHFDGHGKFKEDKDLGYLAFENPRGYQHGTELVSVEELANILVPHNISLVVLSACQSATVGSEPLSSVAAGLTDNGVPTVLAMVYSVLVTTTRQLFAAFYAQLATGQGIGAALDSARQSMASQNQRGTRRRGEATFELTLQDWFVPALYSTGQQDVLLQRNAPKIKKAALCHDLPDLQAAGFFGRSWELWQIERGFVQGVERITITGFGGQGKTYLAVEAGDWLLQTGLFERVCFVDYAAFQGVDALGLAVSTLSTVLHESLLDSAAATQALHRRATLLILDNLESLSPSALEPLLTAAAEWSQAGQSRLLITTRAAELHHAAFPSAHSNKHLALPLRGLSEDDALAFFTTLQKLPPKPSVPPPERRALLALFAQVDYHPLSIALLASQLKTRHPAELGERLAHLLNAMPANHDHKSLLASLQLSLERLPTAQRDCLKRLGVFQGGAGEGMILDVTEISATDWAALRPALENTGLIQVESLAHLGITSPFLKFHPTLAPALWQELSDSEQQALEVRYRQDYYELSDKLYFEDSENSYAGRVVARRELSNLLHALDTSLQVGEAFAVYFANNVNLFLRYFGMQRDRAMRIEKAQQASGVVGSESWVVTRNNYGEHFFDIRQYPQAIIVFQEILEQLDKKIPSSQHCFTLNHLGNCFYSQGKISDAITCYNRGLLIAKDLETSILVQRQISVLHTHLATSFRGNGNYEQARYHYQQALAIEQETGNARDLDVFVIQILLGSLAMLQNNLTEAKQLYQEVLKNLAALNVRNPRMEAEAWHQLGVVYKKEKKWTLAENAYRESAKINEELHNLAAVAMTRNQLAMVAEAQGKLQAAEDWYRKAIDMKTKGNPKELANSLNNLTDLLQNQLNRLDEAKQLAEDALAIKKTLDESNVGIWKTYNLLAQIAEKQQDSAQAQTYHQLARDSYLRFAGMPTQMRQHEWLITSVINAVFQPEQKAEFLEASEYFPEAAQNLAKALQQIINDERNAAVLFESLIYEEAAIVHLILEGIANPDRLKTLFNA